MQAHRLIDAHINPEGRQKKKVKLAAKILSHTLKAGMKGNVEAKKLPAEALCTADLA